MVVELKLGGLDAVKVDVRLCMRRINLAWLYAHDTSSCCEQGFHSNIFDWKFMICYTALNFLCSTSLWCPNPKDTPPTIPFIPSIIYNEPIYSKPFHSFAGFALPISSAPAPAIHGLPVSTTIVWKTTLFPSFHISVLSFWPGRTVPANLTLIFLKGP